MSMESDVASQAVSMELEIAKLLGAGALKILSKLSAGTIALIVAIYRKHKNHEALKPGEISIKKLTDAARKSGTPLMELTIPQEIRKDFAAAVKKRGIQVGIVKDKHFKPPRYDVVVSANDAPRVDRIIEDLKLNTVDFSNSETEKTAERESGSSDHMDGKSADDFFEAMNPDEVINEPDPFAQSRTTDDRSENGSRNSRSENIGGTRNKKRVIYQYETVEKMRNAKSKDKGFNFAKSEGRQSIKDRMNNIKESRAAKAKDNPVREGADKIVDFAEKAKDLKEKVKGREQ